MSEYGEFSAVTDSNVKALSIVREKRFALVFRPGLDTMRIGPKFEVVCKLAYAASEVTFIVEELKVVTSPGHAPPPRVQRSIQGRHVDMRLIGASQRPAHIDTDFLGNASLIRSGMLGYPRDIEAVTDAMRVKPAEVETLKPLQCIEAKRRTLEKRTGLISFDKPRAVRR